MYTLTVTIVCPNCGTVFVNGLEVASGTIMLLEPDSVITVTAAPNPGYIFGWWESNLGNSESNPAIYTVSEDNSYIKLWFRPDIQMSIDVVPSTLILKQGESGTVRITAWHNNSGRLAITHSGSSFGVTVSPGFLWCENGGSVVFTFTAAPDALSTFHGKDGFWRATMFTATEEFSPWAISERCEVWTYPSNGGGDGGGGDGSFPFKNLERFPRLYKFLYSVWSKRKSKS